MCDSCGRSPARTITVRRHVGLLVLQQFVTVRVNACRSCGRSLIKSYTVRTLWQGWWGAISFFFNWFVLATNAVAWRRLGSLPRPSLSGDLVVDAPRGFEGVEQAPAEAEPRRRSRLRKAGLVAFGGFVVLGAVLSIWDGTHHDHDEAHSLLTSAETMTREMTGSSFVSNDGSTIEIAQASCAGDGEASGGGYTHFRCNVSYASGEADEVILHVLTGDELFFRSTTR
jgi:hypothetical protein